MTQRVATERAWMPQFLAALAQSGNAKASARAAGAASGTAYSHRRRNGQFAAAWDAALAAASAAAKTEGVTLEGTRGWRNCFFEALAETSNVTASAARANVPVQTVYKLRRTEAEFANKWRAALLEGYDLLEMELLGHLRDPKPERKMDVAAAIRLLAAHRATVERERALREEDDEEAVRASIDAFLEGMRQRRLAHEARLIEAETADVSR